MQFEPSTFAAYDQPVPPGGASPPSPYDPTDAVFTAARLLCADGAAGGADLSGAVYAYNHSASYVAQVLALAQSYASASTAAPGGSSTLAAASGAGALAVSWALSQIGTPYVWGGETPGVGFDCSGLVQAAYAVAGVALPRVAQDQYDATSKLAAGAALAPGDLVFFGGGPDSIDHVGLYVGVVSGQDVMVDAPHTGADVRAEAFPATVGAVLWEPALRRGDAAVSRSFLDDRFFTGREFRAWARRRLMAVTRRRDLRRSWIFTDLPPAPRADPDRVPAVRP